MPDDMVQALYGQGGNAPPSPLQTAPPPRLEDILRQHYRNAAVSPDTLIAPPGSAAANLNNPYIRGAGAAIGALGEYALGIPKRAFESSESMRAGGELDPGAILEATPGAGRFAAALPSVVGRTAVDVARSAPKTLAAAAGAGGMLAASPTGSEAAPKLTRAQQQEMEMQRQRAEQGTAGDIARMNAQSQAEIAKQQALAKMQADQAAQAKATEAATPFAQRYPNAAKAMAMGGLAASAMIPYGSRAWNLGTYNKNITNMSDMARRAEQAYLQGNTAQGKLLGSALPGMAQESARLEKNIKPGFLGTVAGFEAPSIGTNVPNLLDYVGGTPEQKAKAEESFGDWKRILSSQVSGVGGGMIGAKMPLFNSKLPMPGGIASLSNVKPSMVKALKAEAKKK